MSNKDKIQELKELDSMLAGLPSENLYAVPQGYFEGFASQVLARIKAMNADTAAEELNILSPFLNNLSKVSTYKIPDGYFASFEEKLMASIHQQVEYQTAHDELSSLSPLLSSISKQNLYSVPGGYFENLENNINLKPVTQQPAKVVSMVNRKWFRYAAAAIVIGFIALTGIPFLKTGSGNVSNPHAWVEKNMNKVSTDDINNFIQIADDGTSDQNSVATSAKTDIQDLMKDVSDKDIQDFLNKTTSGNEDADADILLN